MDDGYKCEGETLEFRIKGIGTNEYEIVSIGTGGGTKGLKSVDESN